MTDLLQHVSRRAEALGRLREGKLALHPALARQRSYAQPLPGGSSVAFGDMESTVGDVGDGLLAVDEASMSAGFVVSTARRDRYGDVVLPRGCEKGLADYARNPQVFFSHRSDCLPIARACTPDGKLALWVDDEKLTSRAYFHGDTQESTEVFGLICKGFLKAASIGFVPTLGELIPAAFDQDNVEQGGEIDFDFGGVLFKEWQLLEWSVVPVPANPDALRGLLSGNTKLSPMVRKGLEPFAAPLRGDRPRFSFPRRPKAVQPVRLTTTYHESLHIMSLEDDLRKPPEQPTKKPDGGHDEGDEHEPQAVVMHVSRFQSEQDCVAWLEKNGLKSDQLIAGDEADEPFVAIQFEADECVPETAERKEVENGVELVLCKRKDGQTDDDQTDEPEISDPDPGPTELSVSNLHTKAGVILPEAPSPGEEDLPDSDERDEKRPKEKKPEETKRIPYGAEAHHKIHKALHHCCVTCEEYLGLADNPKVVKNLEKMHKALSDHKDNLAAFHESMYPDHPMPEGEDAGMDDDEVERDDMGDENDVERDDAEDGDEDDKKPAGMKDKPKKPGVEDAEEEDEEDDKPDVEPQDDDDEDEDEDDKPKRPGSKPKKPAGKKPRLADERSMIGSHSKGITRKESGVLSEAAEFMVELSGEDNLKRSQRAACKLHAGELDSVVARHAQAPAVAEEQLSAQEKAELEALEKQIGKLGKIWYSLTGEEI